jgi:serine/threonine protein phosphatase PrpC
LTETAIGVRPVRLAIRHVITNVVGSDTAEVKVELHKVHLEGGDRLLLCSDGLTEMVPEEEINHILQTEPEPEPERACRRLVTRANEAGGKDNITRLWWLISAMRTNRRKQPRTESPRDVLGGVRPELPQRQHTSGPLKLLYASFL